MGHRRVIDVGWLIRPSGAVDNGDCCFRILDLQERMMDRVNWDGQCFTLVAEIVVRTIRMHALETSTLNDEVA